MFLIGEIGSRILQWSVSIGGALVAVFLNCKRCYWLLKR